MLEMVVSSALLAPVSVCPAADAPPCHVVCEDLGISMVGDCAPTERWERAAALEADHGQGAEANRVAWETGSSGG